MPPKMPSTGARSQYDRVLRRLEVMARDPALLEARPADAVFLDDMLLRLKLWAADIKYQESLQWVEKMTEISDTLQGRLRQVEEQCEQFDTMCKGQRSSEESEIDRGAKGIPTSLHFQFKLLILDIGSTVTDTTEAKQNLYRAVGDLVAFATTIKVAASVPEVERTPETMAQVNQSVVETVQPLKGNQSPYIPLSRFLPASLLDELLGSAIIPEELAEDTGIDSGNVPLVKIRRNATKVQATDSQIENFSFPAATLGASRTPTTEWSTIINKRQLKNPHEYCESFAKDHRDDLKKIFADSPKANLAVVSVLLTRLRSGTIKTRTVADEPGTTTTTKTTTKTTTTNTGQTTGTAGSGHSEAMDNLVRNDGEQIIAFACLKLSPPQPGGLGLKLPRVMMRNEQSMGAVKKTYFLVSAFDMPSPPDGPLNLGSILTDPKDAHHPLNMGSPVPIDKSEMATPIMQQTTSFSSGVSPSLSASLLGALGVDTHIKNSGVEATYQFDRLETISFNPTPDYIAKSVKHDGVRKYLEQSIWSRSVYLVTGLKIARGAGIIRTQQHQAFTAEMRLNLGLPAISSAGGVVEGPTGTSETISSRAFDGSEDFVVAFRISVLRFKRRSHFWPKSNDPVVESEPFYKGGFL